LSPPGRAITRTGVERESGVDLGGDTAWDNLQDFLTELDEESVHSVLGLLLEVTVCLARLMTQ